MNISRPAKERMAFVPGQQPDAQEEATDAKEELGVREE